MKLTFVLSALLAATCAFGAPLDQRRAGSGPYVYVNFAINCHDWLDPDMSGAAVLHAARLFAKYKVRADFYVTEPLAYAWAANGTIAELRKLGMVFGYHHRPPHPLWYDSQERRRMLALPAADLYREVERYETYRLDLTTGGLLAGESGGYAGTAKLVGGNPVALGAGAASPALVALDREVLARMGAKMVVAYHSGGDPEFPLVWWQGMLSRPSDFSVVRVPPNSRQRAAGIQVLPRGVADGEEAGNFWWNVTGDPEAQEHSPAKYLMRKVEALPRGRLAFVTCLIHEDNWYKQGTAWDGTYFEDRGRKQPRTPPYKPDPRRMVRLRTEEEQARIRAWWDELVRVAATDPRIRVVVSTDLLQLVRPDDIERTYDREILIPAARVIANADGALPRWVALDNDALSLSDCVQAFTAALAGAKTLRVRTMLGPARPPSEAGEVTFTSSAVTAAARALAAQIGSRRTPDELPAKVKVGDSEVPLETYLYAAARTLLGDKNVNVPPLRSGPPDPARWTAKPARRRT